MSYSGGSGQIETVHYRTSFGSMKQIPILHTNRDTLRWTIENNTTLEESPEAADNNACNTNSSVIFSREAEVDDIIESLERNLETSKSITERDFLGTEYEVGCSLNQHSGSKV